MIENKVSKYNSITIENEIKWLSKLIDNRLTSFFTKKKNINNLSPPILSDDQSLYSNFIKDNALSDIERLILISTIASYFQTKIFDPFLIKNKVCCF